jgi:hypothetical protein
VKLTKFYLQVDGLNSRGESLPQEVPQFEFLDSPLNQHDLDSHVPIDGYGKISNSTFMSLRNCKRRVGDLKF